MSTPLPPVQYDFKIIDLICDLLKDQMDLSDEQVWIYNQKRDIPRTPGLFIEVAFLASKPYGISSQCDDDADGNFCEQQTSYMQETYTVILYSRDESAFTRAPEVLMALGGVAAQQIMEQYCFKLGPIPIAFVDTSAVEASARLFRQDITFQALRSYVKTRVLAYFDQFNIPPDIHPNP